MPVDYSKQIEVIFYHDEISPLPSPKRSVVMADEIINLNN